MKYKDHYYHLAKRKGYVSRAAFKLIQINQRFYLIKRGYTVLDLGASPGGWSQVALRLVGEEGRVIGVDLNPLRIRGVEFVRGDVFSDEVLEHIKNRVSEVDVVLSDMAPKISGVHSLDHARSIELAERAYAIASEMLRDGGHMVVKVFQGDMLGRYLRKLRKHFELVKVHKPQASTPASAETYVVCKRFHRDPISPAQTQQAESGP
ncbi:MAG: RlmE family RNA methyltransferase [Euryarchaeota archaeon]|nr:RlmE family RNA methyltransferase [Euryarchaeota archaeon]